MEKKKREFPFLPAIVSLGAGLIASIVTLVNNNPTIYSLVFVLSFLVGFYVLGEILRSILQAVATKEEPAEEDENSNLEDIQTQNSEDE